MQITDSLFFGVESVYSADNSISSRRNEENQPKPLEWQPDNVNISAEAREAYAAMKAEQESAEAKEETADKNFFAEYMKEAKGETPSTGSTPDEQIEKLEAQLKKLQSKLTQVAQSGKPEDAKQAEMEAVQSEIGALTAQISELKAQVAAAA